MATLNKPPTSSPSATDDPIEPEIDMADTSEITALPALPSRAESTDDGIAESTDNAINESVSGHDDDGMSASNPGPDVEPKPSPRPARRQRPVTIAVSGPSGTNPSDGVDGNRRTSSAERRRIVSAGPEMETSLMWQYGLGLPGGADCEWLNRPAPTTGAASSTLPAQLQDRYGFFLTNSDSDGDGPGAVPLRRPGRRRSIFLRHSSFARPFFWNRDDGDRAAATPTTAAPPPLPITAAAHTPPASADVRRRTRSPFRNFSRAGLAQRLPSLPSLPLNIPLPLQLHSRPADLPLVRIDASPPDPATIRDRDSRRAAIEARRTAKWIRMTGQKRRLRRRRAPGQMGLSTPVKPTSPSSYRSTGSLSDQPLSLATLSRYKFDSMDPQVWARTWKGVPHRIRPYAWYWFLDGSVVREWRRRALDPAVKPGGLSAVETVLMSPSDLEEKFDGSGPMLSHDGLVKLFNQLKSEPCSEDRNIHMDVSRTMSCHPYFRTPFQYGQQALFIVLRVLTLHLPKIGYVQGMASIVAMLLLMYPPDMTFVMTVRIFHLRAVGYLYADAQLANAVTTTSQTDRILKDRYPCVVAQLRDRLDVDAVDTLVLRWYLTLFENSLPMSTQLRVWDVLVLFGDPVVAGKSGLEQMAAYVPVSPCPSAQSIVDCPAVVTRPSIFRSRSWAHSRSDVSGDARPSPTTSASISPVLQPPETTDSRVLVEPDDRRNKTEEPTCLESSPINPAGGIDAIHAVAVALIVCAAAPAVGVSIDCCEGCEIHSNQPDHTTDPTRSHTTDQPQNRILGRNTGSRHGPMRVFYSKSKPQPQLKPDGNVGSTHHPQPGLSTGHPRSPDGDAFERFIKMLTGTVLVADEDGLMRAVKKVWSERKKRPVTAPAVVV